MKEKRYFVNEDYPAETWEDILGLTTEAARRILNDEEFTKWYNERNARFPDGCYLPLEYWLEKDKECKPSFENTLEDKLADATARSEETSNHIDGKTDGLYEGVRNMKLYDLIKNSDDEIAVWDTDYDIETYFYGIKNSKDDMDEWDVAMTELSKLLDVVETSNRGVTVNLSEVIEKNIHVLKKANLFIRCDVDNIMDDIMSILAGNVSEKWLQKFVDVLKVKEREKCVESPQVDKLITDATERSDQTNPQTSPVKDFVKE